VLIRKKTRKGIWIFWRYWNFSWCS